MSKKGATMGQRLQRLRQEAKLTQEEAAQRGGIPVSTLRKWEQGLLRPRLDDAVKLAKALGVDLNKLVGFDEPPQAKRNGGRK
jgi:transcriptional regulator with XRE-family HTH domain